MTKAAQLPENHLDATEAKWFAVYTKYKREKTIEKDLTRQGIQAYLPIQHLTRIYASKKKKVQMPLISCYIFVKITKAEYLSVLQTESVVNFVRIAKNLISIPEREIEIMRKVVGEGIPVMAEPSSAFRKGDQVEIIGGNLTGLSGVLIDNHGAKEVIIDLESMGYSLRMTLEAKFLRKL
ncbi:MAG: UpxY family transcription antiterminator [Saprospiraceae bacterium]